jgi:hypothetical protein
LCVFGSFFRYNTILFRYNPFFLGIIPFVLGIIQYILGINPKQHEINTESDLPFLGIIP